MIKYVLALDQGTTSSRAVLFDRAGRIVSMAQKEFTQLFPREGWVEHDPEEIWSSQAEVAANVLAQAGVRGGEIGALGITNQRETTIAWNRRTGRPVCNAIVWQDRRTGDFCQRLWRAGHEPLIREKTGLLIDPYFSASKLRWILDNVEGARELSRRGELAFGTVDSWLLWKLSGGRLHLTDVTNASRTQLFNIHTLEWDDELLALFEIPRSVLPEVRSCSEVYGECAVPMFPAGLPIAGIAGDQQAALFGQRCTRVGMIKNTYGTGCFLLMNTGSAVVRSANRMLTTIAWQLGPAHSNAGVGVTHGGTAGNGGVQYALEGSIFIAGAVVQWLRDGLGLIRSSGEIEALARSVPDNGGVYLVPAFAGLGAPHWDPFARGLMAGLTRGTGAGHIARAALESIAFQVADVVAAMEGDSGAAAPELRIDGGAAANDLLIQFQADLLGKPIVRPRVLETTAWGAACLAGLATGFWDGEDDLDRHWAVERRFEPAPGDPHIERLKAGWRKALARAGSWADG